MRLTASYLLLLTSSLASASPPITYEPSTTDWTQSVTRDDRSSLVMHWTADKPEGKCLPTYSPDCAISWMQLDWERVGVPVALHLKREKGAFLAAARLTIHQQSPAKGRLCWSRLEVADAQDADIAELHASIGKQMSQWINNCALLSDAMRAQITSQWKEDWQFMLGDLALLWAARDELFVEGKGSGLSIATNSLRVDRTDQELLDLVARACNAENRPVLREDGSIDWTPDRTQVNPPGGYSPDSCVDQQIRYWPGYPGYRRKNAPPAG